MKAETILDAYFPSPFFDKTEKYYALKSMGDISVLFVEWITKNGYVEFPDGRWTNSLNKNITTEQLYQLFNTTT